MVTFDSFELQTGLCLPEWEQRLLWEPHAAALRPIFQFMFLLFFCGAQRPRSLLWEQVCCLKDMELEGDFFAWDKWHLSNLFQFTGCCFLLGVSSSILVVQSANGS